jgi:hypothetical protein
LPVRRTDIAAGALVWRLHRLRHDTSADTRCLWLWLRHTARRVRAQRELRKLRDTVSLCEGLRMRRAVSDGANVKAPFVELADVELRHRCRVRLCTQMQDVEFRCRMQDCTGLRGPVVPSMLRLQPLRYRCGVDGDSALGSAASHIILGLIPHCPRTASVVSETTISAAALSTAGGYRRVARFGQSAHDQRSASCGDSAFESSSSGASALSAL